MKAWAEKDIENLIKDSKFMNPAHKNALRRRLLEDASVLDLEDLEMVAGGRTLSEAEEWVLWQESVENPS